MNPIVIPIAAVERKGQNLFSGLLLFLNLVVMVLLAAGSGSALFRALLWSGAILNLLSLLTLRFKKGPFNQFLKPRNILVIDGLIWIITGKLFVGILMMATGILSFYLSRKQFLTITMEGIVHQHLSTRKIQWPEVEGIIVKNGIITVNLVNDKIIQEQIADGYQVAGLNESIEKYRSHHNE